jgi:hypothetical protein
LWLTKGLFTYGLFCLAWAQAQNAPVKDDPSREAKEAVKAFGFQAVQIALARAIPLLIFPNRNNHSSFNAIFLARWVAPESYPQRKSSSSLNFIISGAKSAFVFNNLRHRLRGNGGSIARKRGSSCEETGA